MSSRLSLAAILATCVCVFFTQLGATHLWDEDEAFFAASAAEMYRRGDLVVPWFNGEMFGHKPPFMYWLMCCGFKLFGVNEFGARFFSAVFGTGAVLLTASLGKRLFGPGAGLWAGLGLASCLMFGVVSRAATADSYLVCVITASLLIYVKSAPGFQRAPDERPIEWRDYLPTRFSHFAAIYALMGLAILIKGPIGLLLPGATIGLFLMLLAASGVMPLETQVRRPNAWAAWTWRVLRAGPRVFWALRPFTALLVSGAVAGPWFMAVGLRTDGAFISEFFGVHNVGRFLNAMENHRGPIVYYIPVALIGFFPWSIFVLPTLVCSARNVQAGAKNQAAWLFVVCWASVVLGFFSIAQTKLPNYILPAYPALALLTAGYLHHWATHRETFWHRWPKLAYGSLATVGAVWLVALPVLVFVKLRGISLLEHCRVNSALIQHIPPLTVIGLIPLIGGLMAWSWHHKTGTKSGLRAFAVTAVAFCLAILVGAAQWLDPHQTSGPALAAVRADAHGAEVQVAEYRHSTPSLIYYAQQPVARLKSPESALAFATAPGRYLITTDVGIGKLGGTVPENLEVIYRQPRFPKPGEILVLREAPKLSEIIAVSHEEQSGERLTK